MKAQCVQAVTAAIGRTLNQQEVKGIEDRIRSTMRTLARTDPQWQTRTAADRLMLAGQDAARQLIGEAALKKRRAALQVTAATARMAEMQEHVAARPGRTLFDGLAEVMRRIDVAGTGIQRETMGKLMDLLEAAQPKFWQLFGQGPEFARDVVMEAFGRSTGNKAAADGAAAWLKIIEELRQRFNRAGGDVGQLDYSYFPQPHDVARVLAAGPKAWVDAVLPKLDRRRYVKEDGARMSDAEVRAFLDEAYKTISTDGLNKLQPGKIPPGVSGLMANRGSQSRAIHFAGPDEYLAYMGDFGRGSPFEAMMGHIRQMSQNIAIVEAMGPNPKSMFETLHDTARISGATDTAGGLRFAVTTRQVWDTLSGVGSAVYDGGQSYVRAASIWQGVRNWQVISKLQGTLLSAMTDLPTYFATTGFNRVPMFDATLTLLREFTPANQAEQAARLGLASESIAADMGRWGSEMLRDGWTSRLANTTMKVSLLNAWTDAIRRAAGIGMMGALGKLHATDWGKLDKADRVRLSEAGFGKADWDVLRLAKLEDWDGTPMLTPEGVRALTDAQLAPFGDPARVRDRVTSKLVGYLVDETEYASLAPDLFTRARVESFGQRGTLNGEIARTMFLFKSFPMAMISRHWTRAVDSWHQGDGTTSRLAYGAGLAVGLTMMGGVSVLLKDIVAGRDPREVTRPQFWAAAMAAGGGMSFFGDVLYATSGGGRSIGGVGTAAQVGSAIMGPVFGAGFEALDLTAGNLSQYLQGKDTDFGAEALRFGRANMPFVNLWYVRSALDRAALHDLQEYLSPGYLGRMRERARRDWGSDFWWTPGEWSPDRAPDLGNVTGG